MNSITSSKPILEIEDLHLFFKIRHFHSPTLRDAFVNFLRAPLETLLGPSESLPVLRGIHLKLHRGERLGLIGVNGSGKTSLCRCIAGMLTPTAGNIVLNGHCRAIFNPQIGVIPELTGRENAHLLAQLIYPELEHKELQAITAESMEFSELGHFLDTPFENYSQGMRARLCLSLMTARSCDLLILDEVTDNTDQFFRKKMEARLQNFLSGAGVVLFVSHSMDHLEKVCDRAAILHEGKIAFEGPLSKAMEAYSFLNQTPLESFNK
ncbi:MAG: hypothetical protein A2070_06155 [Bdellovibrionales bacterium GWC1_52_8]|nr:MAG: hypothetical protein A2Z97_03285 [Bdellovibrionales bacterium GWB1_52_6]OFZ02896.1 MAG: hypothetical protein A2X97_04810 [Bdellovibrionales bacterium GWA1_52_35]OFZ35833.1 MAG: hypothetical protein A2070_06155 [Bdellovibrionales bacterium GWC1_52_8]